MTLMQTDDELERMVTEVKPFGKADTLLSLTTSMPWHTNVLQKDTLMFARLFHGIIVINHC